MGQIAHKLLAFKDWLLRIKLRDAHPNFFLVVLGEIFATLGIGLTLTFAAHLGPIYRYIDALIPIWVCGILFIITSLFLAYGVRWSVKVFRIGLTVGATIATLMSISTLFAAVADFIDLDGSLASTSAAPCLYGFLAVSLLAQSREPRSNPLSEISNASPNQHVTEKES